MSSFFPILAPRMTESRIPMLLPKMFEKALHSYCLNKYTFASPKEMERPSGYRIAHSQLGRNPMAYAGQLSPPNILEKTNKTRLDLTTCSTHGINVVNI